MMKKKYVDAYDWVRIIATILVVIGHSSYLNISTGLGGINYELPSSLNHHYDEMLWTTVRKIGTWAYGFHMPLFFLLSGAVAAISNWGTFEQMVEKKVKRLLVPYFAYGFFFMFPIKYITGFYTKENLYKATESFWGFSESGHLWFLPVLFWCFIFSFFLIKMLEKKGIYYPLLATLVIWILLPDISNGYYGITLSIEYLLFFVIGYVFEKRRQEIRNNFNIRMVIRKVLILSVLVGIMAAKYIKSDDLISVLIKSYWVYCIGDLLANTVGKNSWWNDKIHVLANYCIYIYIFHDPLEYVVLKFAFDHNWLSTGEGVYVYFFSRTFGVFFISLLLGVFVTKVKSIILMYDHYHISKEHKARGK